VQKKNGVLCQLFKRNREYRKGGGERDSYPMSRGGVGERENMKRRKILFRRAVKKSGNAPPIKKKTAKYLQEENAS